MEDKLPPVPLGVLAILFMLAVGCSRNSPPKLNDVRPMFGDGAESQKWIDALRLTEIYYPGTDPDDKYRDWRPPLTTAIYIVSDEQMPDGTYHIRKHEHPSWIPTDGSADALIHYYFPDEPMPTRVAR